MRIHAYVPSQTEVEGALQVLSSLGSAYLGSGPSLLAELSTPFGCPLPALAAALCAALASARARIASAFFPPPPCSNACISIIAIVIHTYPPDAVVTLLHCKLVQL